MNHFHSWMGPAWWAPWPGQAGLGWDRLGWEEVETGPATFAGQRYMVPEADRGC